MIYLTSNGITSPAIRDHLQERSQGGQAAIVTTASLGYKEKDKHIPGIVEILSEMGYQTSFFDFEVDHKKDLAAYDLIYINGGNPFYLLKHALAGDFGGVLKILHESGKILLGASAGSMVLSRSLGLVDLLDPGLNEGVGLEDIKALNLCPVEVCPHYDRFIKRFDQCEDKIRTYEGRLGIEVNRLRDGQALFMDGQTQLILT